MLRFHTFLGGAYACAVQNRNQAQLESALLSFDNIQTQHTKDWLKEMQFVIFKYSYNPVHVWQNKFTDVEFGYYFVDLKFNLIYILYMVFILSLILMWILNLNHDMD